jgi:hypothetical protein
MLLIDTIPLRLELHVGTGNDAGKTFARGVFALAESPTANGRVYPGKIWERETSKLKQKMENRSLFGLLDHPKDGKTSLEKASHLITKLDYTGSNVVGEAEILPTPTGQILKSLIEAGAMVGISSRGVGSTQRGADGRHLVQDDYQLLSFDFVADPAAATAWPKFTAEDQEINENPEGVTMTMTVEQLQQEHPDLFKKIVAEAQRGMMTQDDLDAKLAQRQADMEQQLVSMVSEQHDTALEQARSAALSDPQTAGATLVVESMVTLLRPYLLDEHVEQLVKGKDAKIKQLGEDLDQERDKNASAQETLNELLLKMESVSRRYYMARALNMLEDNEVTGRIFSLVGDPSRFSGTDEFKAAFQAAVKQAQADHTRAEEENSEIARLKEENERLQAARDKAIQIGEALGARAYAEQRLSGHPHAPALRQMMEEANPASTRDVDSIIEGWEGHHDLSPQFQDIYSSLGGDPSTDLTGGLSHLQEGMEDMDDAVLPGGNGVDAYGVFDKGLMEELQQLSGINTPEDNGNGGMPY